MSDILPTRARMVWFFLLVFLECWCLTCWEFLHHRYGHLTYVLWAAGSKWVHVPQVLIYIMALEFSAVGSQERMSNDAVHFSKPWSGNPLPSHPVGAIDCQLYREGNGIARKFSCPLFAPLLAIIPVEMSFPSPSQLSTQLSEQSHLEPQNIRLHFIGISHNK